jgi:hypothetical protein
MLKKPKLIVSVGALLLLTLSTLSGEYVENTKSSRSTKG